MLAPDVVAALCRVRDAENGKDQWTEWCQFLDSQETPHKLPPAAEVIAEIPRTSTVGEQQLLPSVDDLVEEVLVQLKERNRFESLVLAGEGEPLLRMEDLFTLVTKIHSSSSSKSTAIPPIRLTTNGIVKSPDIVSQKLKSRGVSSVSVALMTDDSRQYNDLMKPAIPDAHSRVCRFLEEALKAGLEVEVTGVDRFEVDKTATEQLARSIGISSPIRWRKYFGA